MENRAAQVITNILSRVSATTTFIEKACYFREKILTLQNLWKERIMVSEGRIEEAIKKF